MSHVNRSVVYRHLGTAVRFGVVGLINTGVDFGAFVVLHNAWGVFYLLAQVLSYLVGTANSYILNKLWTFRSREKATGGQAFRFVIINGVSLAISLYGIYALNQLHFSLLGSKLIATIGGVLVNFTGSRFWVFANSAK